MRFPRSVQLGSACAFLVLATPGWTQPTQSPPHKPYQKLFSPGDLEAATRAVNRERDGRAASFDCAIRLIPADPSVDPKIRVGPPERTTRHTIRVIPPPCK